MIAFTDQVDIVRLDLLVGVLFMKIDTSDVKKGVVLDVDGKLMKVLDISHTHTGRGSATYTFKVKNIIDGGSQQLTYKSGTTLEQAEVMTKSAVYLYQAGDTYTFMENDTSQMYTLGEEDIEEVVPYLKENLDCFVMIHEGNVIGVILPNLIEYEVTETVPGVKGDRSSAGKKPATLENWLEVQVPLHTDIGATIKVNTSTGEVS